MEYTEKNYDFELSICHPMISNFKEKIARIITGTIAGSRLNNNMKFESYGRMEFNKEDISETHPYISTMEQFNRVKTNCLIYTLPVTNTNNGYYDKCFIYCHTSTKDVVNYSYIFYNTKTNKVLHDYYIEPEFDDLFRHLNQTFNSFEKKDIFDFASKKRDIMRANNNGTGINERAYKEMMRKHTEKFPMYVTNVTGDRRTNRFIVG